jgi:altronate dehydratase
MNPVIVISERDNVATALEALEVGQVIAGPIPFAVREPIPRGHKVSMCAIAAGGSVIKYGNTIGLATVAIPPGAHVHTHNVASTRGRGDLAEPPDTRRNL